MSLNKYEIACVTAGVPATDDPVLNKIITVGLRYKTANEILSQLSKSGLSAEEATRTSIALADALLSAFRKESDDKK